MKKTWLAALAAMMLMVGFAACQDEVPPYLVIEKIDVDEDDIHGKVIMGVTDPSEVPEQVKIPNGILGIYRKTFSGCTSLNSVTIPKSMKEIDYAAFDGCEDIDVTYMGTLKDWCAVDWDSYLLKNAKRIMLSDGTDLKKLTEITANDLAGVTKIGENAFSRCESLESVEIPKSVKKISYGAFGGCKNIAVVTYKGSFKDWCAVDGDPDLISYAKRIMLSDGTDLKKLTEITADDLAGVTHIGMGAFARCTSLESVEIPKCVTEISYAFGGCKNIAVVTYKGSFKDWCAVEWDRNLISYAKRIVLSDGTDLKKLTEITADDLAGVTRIGENAFRVCTLLESVEIPKCVKEIEIGAFGDCKNIAMVTYKGSFKDWCAVDWDPVLIKCAKRIMLSDGTDPREVTEITANDLAGVTRIGENAFSDCTSLESVEIPKCVKEIGIGAFGGCAKLTSMTISSSVTYIGHNAFRNCTSLASVTIPGSVPKLGEVAFAGCTSLADVTIADGVTAIGNAAFEGCTSLASVGIPRSVTRIYGNAFSNCSPNLKIQYDGTKSQWNAISGIKPKVTVQCSDGIITVK
ncbi:MAG: leucine-rich repeat domain-containing protein [Treponema sp.]|nr:leucine-rich repeat domain-containing protein [Treponema sp.]